MQQGRPNIIWIVLDTVRAGNTTCYGYERNTTPFLKSLADESLFYSHAFSSAPWTTPSHTGMFTGTLSVAHQTDRSNERLTPDLPSLATLLGEAGYRTVGFSNNAHVSPDFDFDRGFDYFQFNTESYNEPLDGGVPVSRVRSNTGDGPWYEQFDEALQYIRDQNGSVIKTVGNWIYRKASENGWVGHSDRGAASTNEFVRKFLSNLNDQPFFLYLNYMEGHAPYQSPDEFQYRYTDNPSVSHWSSQEDYFGQVVDDQEQKINALRDQYDGCISYLDSKIEGLIEILRRKNQFSNSMVVVTSDHGEAFGEWGLYEHKAGLYNELTHVPLIINPPKSESIDISIPVSNRWLFSTSLKQAGVDVPDHAIDADLLDPSPKPVLMESEGLPYSDWVYDNGVPNRFSKPHEAIVMDNKKYIQYQNNDAQLFEIQRESQNNQRFDVEESDAMKSKLQELLTEATRPTRSDSCSDDTITEETRSQLRELGYR